MTRHEFMASRLSELEGYWIEVTCPAKCAGGGVARTGGLPCKLLVKRGWGHLFVGEVIARLRCERCGSRPSLVVAMDHPAGRCPQYPTTWEETIWP